MAAKLDPRTFALGLAMHARAPVKGGYVDRFQRALIRKERKLRKALENMPHVYDRPTQKDE